MVDFDNLENKQKNKQIHPKKVLLNELLDTLPPAELKEHGLKIKQQLREERQTREKIGLRKLLESWQPLTDDEALPDIEDFPIK